MSGTRLLGDPVKVIALAERLLAIPKLAEVDENGEPSAFNLAYTFSELEESFRQFLDVQLPRLVRGDLQPGDLDDVLDDIGAEFGHILYHLRDARYYSSWYLYPDE